MSGKRSSQVVVIGGGPAGSVAATVLAEAGVRTLILEREQFPRFHIGESLMTETYWTFERIGLLDSLKASDFPRKYSVQFVLENGKPSRPFYFYESNPHESAVTWQVDRAELADEASDTPTAASTAPVHWSGRWMRNQRVKRR